MDRIDIRLRGPIDDLEEDRFRGYIEAAWRAAAEHGWADIEDLKRRVEALEDFSIFVPAEVAPTAIAVIEKALSEPGLHMYVTLKHVAGGADG